MMCVRMHLHVWRPRACCMNNPQMSEENTKSNLTSNLHVIYEITRFVG